MAAKVLMLGTLDTKGEDYRFVRDLLREAGLETLLVDTGVMGEPLLQPDIGREMVADAAGVDLADFRSGTRKDEAMRAMAEGAAQVVRDLHQTEAVAGIFGMGGTSGTAMVTAAMRVLPVGIPKVVVSTVGGGDVSAYSGGKDIIFFPSIVDVSGLNRISRIIYANAAHAMIGMMNASPLLGSTDDRPLLAASMFGNSTPCVMAVKATLESQGYEVLIFHATGTGGRTMEALMEQGLFEGVLDITTTEIADNVCGGVMDAGPERCQTGPRLGLPTVLVPGCVDMVNFWGVATVPEKYRDRHLYRWNPQVTLMRTSVEENREIGERLARAANGATGPVSVVIPMRGVSMLDEAGAAFHDPQADHACFDAIRESLRPGIPLIEVEHPINAPEFAEVVAAQMQALLRQVDGKH